MKLPRAALLVLVLMPACGGHVDETPRRIVGGEGPASQPAASGGAAGDESLASPESGSGMGRGGDNGSVADGGEGGRAVPTPTIGSATRYCAADEYCFGLSCYAPDGFDSNQRVCVKACATNDDCWPGEQCLSSVDLAPGCYPTCESPRDCAYGLDCFDFTNQHQDLVCFPTPWARLWGGKYH